MRGKEGFSLGMCRAHTSQVSYPWVALGSPIPCGYIAIYLGFHLINSLLTPYLNSLPLNLKVIILRSL